MSDNSVFIAEAYKDGERVERVVHTTQEDAADDIITLTDADRIEIESCRVWLGQSDSFEVTR